MGNMAMTINHATHKPTIKRSNKIIARPISQLRSILAKELIHDNKKLEFNKCLLQHKTKDNYDSCSYVTQVVGGIKPSHYSFNHYGCEYLRVCNVCGWAGGYKKCKSCNNNIKHSNTTLIWMCKHVKEKVAKQYKVRSVFQGELSKYFCAKTMSYIGNFDNLDTVGNLDSL